MTFLLPFIAVALIFRLNLTQEVGWRNTILTTSVIFGIFVVGITEGLSVVHLLNFQGVCTAWTILNGYLGLLAWKRLGIRRDRENYSWKLLSEHRVLLLGVATIISLVGFIALVAPPNNWDSMVYVMPRVSHWIQNFTLDHYPTHSPLQLTSGPWAEFVILHFQLLAGNDRFANLLNWLSWIGSLIGVSLITKQLGGNLQSQIFSSAFCATIPVGILQASTPKNTCVVSFWIVCFAYYALMIVTTQRTLKLTLLISASLGLAILTKGTSYVYALPIIFIVLLSQFYGSKSSLIKHFLISFTVVLSLNLGHYWRNFYTFGSPTSTYPDKLTNDMYSIPAFISNLVRNISLHLTVPFLSGADWVDQAVIQFHRFLGISPVDPRTTFGSIRTIVTPEDFTINTSPLFEDVVGNPLHFWLIVAVIISIFSFKKRCKSLYLVEYLIVILSSFILFCFLLKWQPWHSRLHLPIFVLLTPIVGIVLDAIWPRKISQYTFLVLLVSSIPYLLLNDLRPIVGETSILKIDRTSQYFAAKSQLESNYTTVSQIIKRQACQNVGLIIVPNSWEYPLWILLEEKGSPPIRIEHVAVTNMTQGMSQRQYAQNFSPCSVIAIGNKLDLDDQITLHNQTYKRYWQSSPDSRELVQLFIQTIK